MGRSLGLLFVLVTGSVALGGCMDTTMKPPKEVWAPDDEWSKLTPSKEWLFATAEFSGPHKAECDHVLAWVKGEEVCKAALCSYGRDLASEWLTRCSALEDKGLASTVDEVRSRLSIRAEGKPTDCESVFQKLLRSGCGDEDPTCALAGQRWATRCAKAEGTPLVIRILEKTIARRDEQGTAVTFDTRTCDELGGEVKGATKCTDAFACEEQVGRVETYRSRCESETERPSLAVAASELIIAVGGNKPGWPIVLSGTAKALQPNEVPVPLADGSGVMIHVCGERASELDRYVNARSTCQNGQIALAKTFPTKAGLELRAGSLEFPNDALFRTRFPSLVAVGEAERAEQAEARGLDEAMTKVAQQWVAPSSAAEAVRSLAHAIFEHQGAIRRSAAIKAVLAKHDSAIAPVLREIARLKVAFARKALPPGDLAGLATRGRTRPFADLTKDGAVAIGYVNGGSLLDTTTIWPTAMAAYGATLKELRLKKIDKKVEKAEKDRGVAAAAVCGSSEKKLEEYTKGVLACAFGIETCDANKQAELTKAIDEARTKAEAAYQEFDAARTGGGNGEEVALLRAFDAEGCREPWW